MHRLVHLNLCSKHTVFCKFVISSKNDKVLYVLYQSLCKVCQLLCSLIHTHIPLHTMHYLSAALFPLQVHGPASQHVSNSTMTVSVPTPAILSRGLVVDDHRDEYRKEALRKGKCLSIGIQVFIRLD